MRGYKVIESEYGFSFSDRVAKQIDLHQDLIDQKLLGLEVEKVADRLAEILMPDEKSPAHHAQVWQRTQWLRVF